MRWRDRSNDWKRRFAFLPMEVEGEVVWLEWVECRFSCDYTEVRNIQITAKNEE